MLLMEIITMLNQFIQICIQLRNDGAVATGCLIDGLIIMVDGSLGQATWLTHDLGDRHLKRDRDHGGCLLRLGDFRRFLRLRPDDTPRSGWQWQQG